jgi:hypothetical protein
MRTQPTPKIRQGKVWGSTLISLLCLVTLPPPTFGQNPANQALQAKVNERARRKISEADPMEEERRAFAISLVISIANEARSYSDVTLRPHVLARSADVLWNADNTTARDLFRRAWEAAEKGDAEDAYGKTKDNAPPMVSALRRASGRDLRSDVLNLAARRGRCSGFSRVQ